MKTNYQDDSAIFFTLTLATTWLKEDTVEFLVDGVRSLPKRGDMYIRCLFYEETCDTHADRR